MVLSEIQLQLFQELSKNKTNISDNAELLILPKVKTWKGKHG